jgi:hypothetical protein
MNLHGDLRLSNIDHSLPKFVRHGVLQSPRITINATTSRSNTTEIAQPLIHYEISKSTSLQTSNWNEISSSSSTFGHCQPYITDEQALHMQNLATSVLAKQDLTLADQASGVVTHSHQGRRRRTRGRRGSSLAATAVANRSLVRHLPALGPKM